MIAYQALTELAHSSCEIQCFSVFCIDATPLIPLDKKTGVVTSLDNLTAEHLSTLLNEVLSNRARTHRHAWCSTFVFRD